MAKRVEIPLTPYGESASLNDANYFVTNADIGDYSYVSSTEFDASRIPMSRIGNVLGSASRSLATLCQSGNINPHALFLPDGNSPYRMGDFAGYNHEAKPNTYWTHGNTWDIVKDYGDSATITNIGYTYGEKAPQLANGEYHRRYSGIYLLGVQLRINSVNLGSVVEYNSANFPQLSNYSFPPSVNTDGQYPVELVYQTRTVGFPTWVDANNIEDGDGVINLTVVKPYIVTAEDPNAPNTLTENHPTQGWSGTFNYSFTVKNDTADNRTHTLYFEFDEVGGGILYKDTQSVPLNAGASTTLNKSFTIASNNGLFAPNSYTVRCYMRGHSDSPTSTYAYSIGQTYATEILPFGS